MSSKPGAFLSPGISPPDTWLLGGRRPAYRGREADPGFCVELREPVVPMPREKHKWNQPRGESAKAGSAGVDKETIEDFESDLKDNLYRIWNRMSSGSYFPPPVKAVAIPKKNGGVRILGIPTVADRIAQTAVKMWLEPRLDPIFRPDSYGYRPGKSALAAITVTRRRCWDYDWVVEFDIRGLLDVVSY